MVTLVTVYWENLKFRSKYKMMELNELIFSITEVLETQVKFPLPPNPPKGFNTYFMKLNGAELLSISSQMRSGVLEQVKSQSSILVKDRCAHLKRIFLC